MDDQESMSTSPNVDEGLVEHQLKCCSQIITKLKRNPNAFPFNEPVDPVKLGIPDYPLKIKYPMDISTIKKKLDTKIYSHPSEFDADVRLMFNNCYTYNHSSTDVYAMGKKLEKYYEDLYQNLPTDKRKRRKLDIGINKQTRRNAKMGDQMKIDDYEFCIKVLNEIFKPKYKNINYPFIDRINENEIPQYYEVIQNPICLKDIKEKLDNKMYSSMENFNNDLKLIVENCFKFNEKESLIYKCGEEFNILIKDLLSKYEPKDIKGRIIELKKKITTYTREIKYLESKLKDKNDFPASKSYSLNERIDLGNRILNLNKVQTNYVARILQKHSAGEFVENDELEVDMRILPDNVLEEVEEYVSKVEIGIEEGPDDDLLEG